MCSGAPVSLLKEMGFCFGYTCSKLLPGVVTASKDRSFPRRGWVLVLTFLLDSTCPIQHSDPTSLDELNESVLERDPDLIQQTVINDRHSALHIVAANDRRKVCLSVLFIVVQNLIAVTCRDLK
ncbi:unnamed protein product [Lactuca saligna]|uniref:Uncharacterized protein n=1 Tax=Lactuca saligna TaxID=75948 RepID=A0AA35YRE7_LACSI|nr:unnamed protein product [Lactuca saligna]